MFFRVTSKKVYIYKKKKVVLELNQVFNNNEATLSYLLEYLTKFKMYVYFKNIILSLVYDHSNY